MTKKETIEDVAKKQREEMNGAPKNPSKRIQMRKKQLKEFKKHNEKIKFITLECLIAANLHQPNLTSEQNIKFLKKKGFKLNILQMEGSNDHVLLIQKKRFFRHDNLVVCRQFNLDEVVVPENG